MLIKNGQTDVTTYFVLRDSTNHAPKTDVTVTDIDLYYVEQGAAISAKADVVALAAADSAHGDNKGFHVGNGMYRLDWPDEAFNGGIGKIVELIVVCTSVDTTFLEVELSAAVDAVAISSDATAADNAESFFDGTGYAGTNNVIPTVTTTGTATNLTNLPAAAALEATLTAMKGATFSGATDSLEALRDRGDSAWITATGFATPTNITAGTITTVTNLTNAPTNGDLTATMKTSVTTAATAATPTAAAVTGAVGSVTGNVGGNVTGSVGSVATGGITAASIANGAIDNATFAADVGSTAYATNIIALAADKAIANAALATAANLATLTGYVDTEVAAILADTNELQTDLVNGGRLDLLIDAIKAKTDNLPTDPADQSAVEAAITAATSPLATSVAVADLPTNAELATALGTADDAVLAAIAALNNLSSVGAQAAAAAALAAYGAATQSILTKLDTALALDGAVYQFTANALELAPTGGSAPTAAQIRAEIDSNSTQLAAIVADTNELQTDWHDGGRLDLLLDGATAPTAAAVADAVWDEATSGHATAGSTGAALTAAQSAGDPWTAAVRTLTQSAAQVTAAVTGSALAITRGDTFTATITGLGNITARSKLWFALKSSDVQADTAALLLVEATAGLTVVNGVTYATIANGALTVNDATTGSVTITIKPAVTSLLMPAAGLVYDIQMLTSTGAVQTLTAGAATINADVTRAIA